MTNDLQDIAQPAAAGMDSLEDSWHSGTNRKKIQRLKDATLYSVCLGLGLIATIVIVLIAYRLFADTALTRSAFGFKFLTGTTWDINHKQYGIAPFLIGTIVTSILGLGLAIPLGVGTAIFLREVIPQRFALPISYLVELLAAVPSIVFGLWGFLVLCPFLGNTFYPWLAKNFAGTKFIGEFTSSTNLLSASIILAIMVLPIIAAITGEILASIPKGHRDNALALGATKWECIRKVILPEARTGIVGAAMLGFGRAVGETMAVVLVIGNAVQPHVQLLNSGYTMPSLLANTFREASDKMQISALLEVGLVLLVFTFLINLGARLLIMNAKKRSLPSHLLPLQEVLDQGKVMAGLFIKVLAVVLLAYGVFQPFLSESGDGLHSPVSIGCAGLLLIIATNSFLPGTRFALLHRKVNSLVMTVAVFLTTLLAIAVLFAVMVYVAKQGAGGFNRDLFFSLPKPEGIPHSGLMNAILGTVILIGLASIVGVPVGIAGGVFLSEFKTSRLTPILRFSADILAGIPSIVIGVFAFAAIVVPMHRPSGIAASAALSIMMIPSIMRTTEEILRLIPTATRDASLALGADKTQTIWKVVLPAARSGIITGVMLSIARIAGETAPLLFTTATDPWLKLDPRGTVPALTLTIYDYVQQPYPDRITQAWAGAFILIVIIAILNLVVKILTRKRTATA